MVMVMFVFSIFVKSNRHNSLFVLKKTILNRNLKISTPSLFHSDVLHLLTPVVWVLIPMAPTTVVEDTVAGVIEVPLALRGTVIALRQRKKR